uniref:Valosin containing protein lysine (K) methyltransferase n=1 Tax=Petromyzon marinus TaxID=7757 RepID=S4RP52_PETMA
RGAGMEEESVWLLPRSIERRDGGGPVWIRQGAVGDVGCVVWDAAIVLAKYLETDAFRLRGGEGERSCLRGRRVLELGAGTGAVGLVAASCGAYVTLTDLPQFMDLIETNIKDNSALLKGRAQAKVLEWGKSIEEFLPHPDYILMADCIYYEQSLEPLVRTLGALSGPNTLVICCYEERTAGRNPLIQSRFIQLIEQEFEVEKIPVENHDQEFCSDDINILHLRKNVPKVPT